MYWLLEKQDKLYFLQSSQTLREKVSPLPIYLPETHGEFRAAPKNAVHFLYGAALHRPGGTPGPPYAVLCGTELRFCGTELRFGSLCNLGLSKTLRFSLQRHKTAKSCAFCDSLPVPVLGTAMSKSSRIRRSRILGLYAGSRL